MPFMQENDVNINHDYSPYRLWAELCMNFNCYLVSSPLLALKSKMYFQQDKHNSYYLNINSICSRKFKGKRGYKSNGSKSINFTFMSCN